MTNSAATESRQHEIEPPLAGSLEARASMALKILAIINVAGAIFATFPAELPASVLREVAFNAAACALAAIELIVARGLDRRRPWAVATVRPLLVLLAAFGIASLLAGLGEGRIRLPYETAFAGWALLAAADPELTRGPDRRSLLATGGALLLMASMLFAGPIFGWGGLLELRPSDLHASLEVDCGAPGVGPPETVTVAYDWSWSRPGLVSSGFDSVVIGWAMSDDAGRPVYLFDRDPTTGAGIASGIRAYPSADMTTRVAKESEGSWHWGIDLASQGLRPGRVEVQLRRVRDASPEPAPLVVTATYVHLGVWRSDPVTVTCSW